MLPVIDFPELFFGLVAPIGADIESAVSELRKQIEIKNYNVKVIKVTDCFKCFKKAVNPKTNLVDSPLLERYKSHIAYGNQLRRDTADPEILAKAAIYQIIRFRNKIIRFRNQNDESYKKTAYIIHQFKRREEIELMRQVYGNHFFQISIYSRRSSRVDFLARKFASSANSTAANALRSEAEAIVHRDEEESDDKIFGQRVRDVFHDADLILNQDVSGSSLNYQTERFIELIFNSNKISPTKNEYGMFIAKAAALRSLDLSRQVGAAVFSNSGEVLSLGTNEVPKAYGGSYWEGEKFDDREYKRGSDSNENRKKEILGEIKKFITERFDVTSECIEDITELQFMDALEYGRVVHAEMSAICDAARIGRCIEGSVLYTTTFPCHMCAKHIISSGIKSVVFLEPYPKSLAGILHQDALQIEAGERGQYNDYPSVKFEHFWGVTPRAFRQMFERRKRKDKEGKFCEYGDDGVARPNIAVTSAFYIPMEKKCLSQFINKLSALSKT